MPLTELYFDFETLTKKEQTERLRRHRGPPVFSLSVFFALNLLFTLHLIFI